MWLARCGRMSDPHATGLNQIMFKQQHRQVQKTRCCDQGHSSSNCSSLPTLRWPTSGYMFRFCGIYTTSKCLEETQLPAHPTPLGPHYPHLGCQLWDLRQRRQRQRGLRGWQWRLGRRGWRRRPRRCAKTAIAGHCLPG